jgi:hypothetical protein
MPARLSRKLFALLLALLLIVQVSLVYATDFSLVDPADYDARYDGVYSVVQDDGSFLTEPGILIGDVNGDGVDDLVLGADGVSGNDDYAGSVYVIFGDERSGDLPLSTASNFNIRFDGEVDGETIGIDRALALGDVNGDGVDDLIIGTSFSPNGTVWVVFSTLIDDVGATTGNVWSLADAGTYNIRYDAENAGDNLTQDGAIGVGDVNGDGWGDLIMGSQFASYNGDESGSAWVVFSTLIDDVGATTGNDQSLGVGTNYNIRYDGAEAFTSNFTGSGAIKVGDVNGDGEEDLILGDGNASGGGATRGSAWVMFSTLIDDVGATTGNDKPLDVGTNYNIRYDGSADSERITYGGGPGASSSMAIGDVNGDGVEDLVIGGPDGGVVYVLFSTLIDDVGATTGNDKPLDVGTNYNIRYEEAAANDNLTDSGALAIGDVNGDSLGDLVLGARATDFNGASSGSAYLMFSTLIDDVGATTGNDKSLGTGTNYNIRYDGEAAGDNLTEDGAIRVGDLDADGLGDLVLGTNRFDGNGIGSSTGAVFTFLSTLIDDGGATTGNNQSLGVAANYTDRYVGAANDDNLTVNGALAIGDVSGDGSSDLVMGTPFAANNGANSGSAWIVYGPTPVPPNSDPNAPASLGGHVSGAYTADDTPTLTFTLSDPDAGDQLKFQIQIDNSVGFPSPEINSTSALGAQGARSFTSSALADGSYYWRVKAIDDSDAESAYTTANGGAVAFRVDTTAPSVPGTPSSGSESSDTTPAWIWTAATDAGSGLRAADTYFLQWTQDPSFTSGLFSILVSANSFTHTTALEDGTWYLRVRAYDEVGNVSGFSAAGSFTVSTSVPPPPPTEEEPISGCTDSLATNYDPEAEADNGSCQYLPEEPMGGCIDPTATNYNSDAEVDDGSCQYPIEEPPGEEPPPAEEEPSLIETVVAALTGLGEAILDLGDSIIRGVDTLAQSVQRLPLPVKQGSDLVSKGALPVIAATLWLQTGIFLYDLPLLLNIQFLGAAVLALFGLRKKKERPWGVIYDSITKHPLNFGIIRLFSKSGQEIGAEITDQFGAFSFLPAPGAYALGAQRPGYLFPSKLVKGARDGEYENIYRGGEFAVGPEQAVVSLSVPLDPPDTSAYGRVRTIFRRRGFGINAVILSIGGLLSVLSYLAIPTALNQILVVVYMGGLAVLLASRTTTASRWGVVKDDRGKPQAGVALALVDAKSGALVKRRVTNPEGRYQFLAPRGEYRILISSVDWERVSFKDGYQGENIRLKKEGDLVNPGITVRKKPETALKRREV